ncbi:MAG: hypothetical protein C4522_15715 [Desulfobacteraceae bacterium]|nr:MAG: hypothetical protein C4522_15715 [Desulfobacteraceae bacterium]
MALILPTIKIHNRIILFIGCQHIITEKLLDEVREVMRLDHYSIHTERTYCDWIKQYIHFHKMKSRDDLQNGEAKIPEKAIRTA